ncbi:hypothetical protein GCM10010169_48680 [Micromonospora fulviviridis]|uniref:hypothetical protein n=1 Tax=Micromonospora fulviviridis TaxID=47860 RepID=UPI00166A8F45|nr:hypothetical protein [Micromonospora fulviviridis]GGR98376.1 hypothetical protein GCM10010169_48680 [Micromonospora fulviviridis]
MTTNPPGIVFTGGTAGLTFVPTDTPLVGLNYFDGRFLRAADLNQERRAQRAYVEFANRAGGPGVVHGYDVSKRSDTRLGLSAGLAVDPQGRMLYLPEAVEADVPALLTPAPDSPVVETPSVGFTCCARSVVATSGTVVGTTTLYLVCLSQAQQMCGETEVFGRLCADACATPTDAPYLVDGVTLSLRPLVLSAALPALPRVTRPEVHLRSQVAAAYFAEEWQQGGSLLSAAELGLHRWCAGAPPAAGAPLAGADVVPLAVLGWNGAQITLLDGWTARRERMTTPPRSYWDGRLELRPWPVFLAQVLQFQCQLADLQRASPAALRHAVDPDRPDNPAHDLLQWSAQVIEQLAGELSRAGRPSAAARASDLFKARVTEAVEAVPAAATSAQVLVDNGFVELPPAGYLPVDLSTRIPLRRQLENLLGPGVDLRLCTVRQDQIAHELELATHMRRISLLHGIEHPDAQEPVDVLVPNGTLHPAGATRTGVSLAVDIDIAVGRRNGQQRSGERLTHPAAQIDRQPSLYGAARIEPGPAIQATVVAFGAVEERVEYLIRRRIRPPTRPPASLAETITGLDGLNIGTTAPCMAKVRDVAHRVKRCATRVASAPQAPGEQVVATLLSLWIPVDPFAMPQGGTAPFNATFEIVLPGSDRMSMTQRFDGQIQRGLDRADAPETEVVLELSGCAEATYDPDHLKLNWSFSHTFIARRMMLEGYEAIWITDDSFRWVAAVAWKGSPVRARGLLLDLFQVDVPDADALLAALRAALREQLPKGTKRILAVDGTEDPTILQPGNAYHDAAVAALKILSTLHADGALYVKRGVRRLFPPRATTSAEVRATKDWVLFRRRLHEQCEGPVDAPSVAPSRVAVWLFHAADEGQARDLEALLRGNAGEEIPWKKVDVVEFEPGTTNLLTKSAAWQRHYKQAGGANTIRFAGYGVVPGSATAPVKVGQGRALALVYACAGVATLANDGDGDLIVNPPADQLEAGTDASIFLITYEEVSDCVQVIAVDACGDGGQALADAVRSGNVDDVDQSGEQFHVLADIHFNSDSDRRDLIGQIGGALNEYAWEVRQRCDISSPVGLESIAWTRVPRDQQAVAADHCATIYSGLRRSVGGSHVEWLGPPDRPMAINFSGEGCPTRLYVLLTPTQIG